MKWYRATNIKWDTDGQEVDLPKTADFELFDEDSPEEHGADCLSDMYGFCVESFDCEPIDEEDSSDDDDDDTLADL